jgi:hypothetical protein
MKKYKPIKSRSVAVNTLKRFFSEKPNVNELTYNDIVSATKRTEYDREKNMAWLSNKWPTLKHYEFIRVEYEYGDGPKKFGKIILLPEGKRALGRQEERVQTSLISSHTNEVTPETVLRDVKLLRERYPSFEVIFDFRPKDTV